MNTLGDEMRICYRLVVTIIIAYDLIDSQHGARELRLALIIKSDVEKIRSEGVLVAEIAKVMHASIASLVKFALRIPP